MTRFARAKGSKASNERREEEATPWNVMRQQLVDQSSGNNSKANETHYDIKNLLSNKSLSNKEEIWSDFGESKLKSTKSSSKNLIKSKKIVQSKIDLSLQGDVSNNVSRISGLTTERNVPETENIKIVGKKRKLALQDKSIVETFPKKKKKSKITSEVLSLKRNDHLPCNKSTSSEDVSQQETHVKELNYKSPENKSNKRKQSNLLKRENNPRKKEKLNNNSVEISNEYLANDVKPESLQTNSENLVTSKPKALPKETKPGKININSSFNDRNHKNSKQNFQNPRFNSQTQTIFANNREIKVKPYEGFLVKEEDARELQVLRKKLKGEKIPQEQIKQIMKLERRKAEKALAREKTKVCFHCRKFGHKLSDCPEVDDKDLAKSGMCFKCGSTEHSYFDCKVSRGQDFRHAVCFVCKEQGHIARQCPLNPQGQYPRGGSCHFCGEVTHLRKDCPKAKEEQDSANNAMNKFTTNDLEEAKPVTVKHSQKKKLIVKF